MPDRRHVARRQSALAGGLVVGFFARHSFFSNLRYELIERTGAGLGLVAKRNGDFPPGDACVGLPLAESSHVRNGCAGQAHSFRSVNLRIWKRGIRAARQQHADDG